jgi:hypothetical protein
MSIFTDITTIEQKVVTFFKGTVETDASKVLTASNNFLNIVKTLSTSATGETIITLGEAFFPGFAGVVSGAEGILSELLGITSETPGQVLLQAAQKAGSLTGATAKVAAFTNIATAIASAANDASKGTLTPQQIVSVLPLVHAPDVLTQVAQVVATAVTPNTSAQNQNAGNVPNG